MFFQWNTISEVAEEPEAHCKETWKTLVQRTGLRQLKLVSAGSRHYE